MPVRDKVQPIKEVSPTIQLVKEADVVRMLKVRPQTLRNHHNMRKGLPYVRLGSTIRYDLDEVLDFVQERKVNPVQR